MMKFLFWANSWCWKVVSSQNSVNDRNSYNMNVLLIFATLPLLTTSRQNAR